MRKTLTASAAALALCVVAVAAETQTPSPGQTITVSGCAQKESDVLKRSPMAGDVGMSDEYVLTRAKLKLSAPAPKTPEQDPSAPPEATGTAGTSDPGKVYRVTGDKENELKKHVGQSVEIVGKFKHEDDARRELGTTGTSGKPASSASEMTPANTPEITIESIRMIAPSCGR